VGQIRHLILKPLLSFEDAVREHQGRYLCGRDYDVLVEESTLGLVDGKTKFLLLHNVTPPRNAAQILRSLRRLPFYRGSRRAALKGSRPSQLALGGLDDKPGGARLLSPTYDNPLDHFTFRTWMLQGFSALTQEYLPDDWAAQRAAARQNGRKILAAEWWNPNSIAFVRPGFMGEKTTGSVPKAPIYSTMTVNRNAIFRSHVDSGNQSSLSCLAVYGRWLGGELCFPRLRVAFSLKQGDILIADTNSEQHGTVGPTLAGERISVVAYLRDLREVPSNQRQSRACY
jgi:hypothetical protein